MSEDPSHKTPGPQDLKTAPWYSDGLRFECTMCGKCCSGPPGYVLYTPEEAAAMAAKLGLTVQEFEARYTHDMGLAISGRRRSLNEVETEFGQDCVLLDRTSVPGKALCRVHEARPVQCRTFPFWPEHIKSPRAWQKLSRECEGIERGPVVSSAQITVEREAQERDRDAPHG